MEGSIAKKVAFLKRELDLDQSLTINEAVREASRQVGKSALPGSSIREHADTLLRAIGIKDTSAVGVAARLSRMSAQSARDQSDPFMSQDPPAVSNAMTVSSA